MINFLKNYNDPIEGDLVEVAVKHGMTNFLDFLLDEEGAVLEQKHMKAILTADLQTPSKVKMIKYLVQRGLVVNGHVGMKTYLGHELAEGRITVVRTLLRLGADVNANDREGFSPLVHCKDAPRKKIIPLMKILLQHGADERIVSTKGVEVNTIETICFLGDTSVSEMAEAALLAKSVKNWRVREQFSLVSKAFLATKNAKFKTKTKSKKSKFLFDLNFLELHGDILFEVFSFF